MADVHIIPERCSWKRPQQHANDDIYHQIEMPWIKRGVDYQKWREIAPEIEKQEAEDEKVAKTETEEPQSPTKSGAASKGRSNRRKPKSKLRRRIKRRNKGKLGTKTVPNTIAEDLQDDEPEFDEQEIINQTKQKFNTILNDITLKIRRASTFRVHDQTPKIQRQATEAAVSELEEKIRKELAGMDNVDISKDKNINQTIHDLAEIKPIIDEIKKTMMIKHDMHLWKCGGCGLHNYSSTGNQCVACFDNAINFTESHQANPNKSGIAQNPLSKEGWNQDDEHDQLDIFNQFAAEIQDESDEEEIEHDFDSLQQYKQDLQLALKSIATDAYNPYVYQPLLSDDDGNDEDAIKRHEEDEDIWQEYDDNERAQIAMKQRMKSMQTRDTIQKELDALQLAVKSTSNRMSQVKHVPITKLMKSRSRHISYYPPKGFFGDDEMDSSEEINNESSDPKQRFAAIAEEPEYDDMDSDGETDDIMVDNLFWNDTPEEAEVDVEQLQTKQLQLVKYENALRGSLALVRQKTQNMALEVEKSYYNDDIKYIEDELAQVMGELMDIGAQVNQLNLHNNQINEAMMKDYKRASVIEAKQYQTQVQNFGLTHSPKMIEWHPQSYINENYIPRGIISPDINSPSQQRFSDLDPEQLKRDTFGSIKKRAKQGASYEETVFNAEPVDDDIDVTANANPVVRRSKSQFRPSHAQKQAIARSKSMPSQRESHHPPVGFWGDQSNRSSIDSINGQDFSRKQSVKERPSYYPPADFFGGDESQRVYVAEQRKSMGVSPRDSIADKVKVQRGSFYSPKDFWQAVQNPNSMDQWKAALSKEEEQQRRSSMAVNPSKSHEASQRQSNVDNEYLQKQSMSAPNPIPASTQAQAQSAKAATEDHVRVFPDAAKVQRQSTDPAAIKQASSQRQSELDIYAIPETESTKKRNVTFGNVNLPNRMNHRRSQYNRAQRKNYKPGALSAYPEPSQNQNDAASESAVSQRPSIIRRKTDYVPKQRDTVTNAWLKSRRPTEPQRPSYYPPKNFWASNANNNDSSSQRPSYYPPADFFGDDDEQDEEQKVYDAYQRQIAAIREQQARKYSKFQKSAPQHQPKNMQMIQPSHYQPIMGRVVFNQATGWTKLYECNDNGNKVDGDLDTLLSHVNNGAEVRVMINNHYGWNASNVWISDGQLFVQNTQQMILKHPLSFGDGLNDFDILRCNPRQIYYEVVNTLGQRHVAKYVQGGSQGQSKTRCNIKFFAKY